MWCPQHLTTELYAELNELFSSASIIRMIKPRRRTRWAGHVARMRKKRKCISY
jgi:hypothetical protein